MFLGVFQVLRLKSPRPWKEQGSCKERARQATSWFRFRASGSNIAFLCVLGVLGGWLSSVPARGQAVAANNKHVIGATAKLTEVESGFTFPARIDTGAQSCSLHIEKFEIKDADERRLRNVGKTIRFQLKDTGGKTKWIEAKIAQAVRVKSSTLKAGEYDQRYKVRLTLQWKDFKKKVLVTLNNRTDMEFPLLIGRNFLRNDFVVDVANKE
jgi:hypothetical protein